MDIVTAPAPLPEEPPEVPCFDQGTAPVGCYSEPAKCNVDDWIDYARALRARLQEEIAKREEVEKFIESAFAAHPNLDLDIAALSKESK
jgi:hypothetical protein